MNLEAIKNNKRGVILQFSIPAIISMLLTAMITVADGYFAGNYIGTEAIAAINLGLPIVYLFLGIGLMISVGGMAIAGMALGRHDVKTCKEVFNQTITTTAVVSIALSLLVFLLFEPLLDLLKAEGAVREMFREYYLILLFELPILIINSSLGMFIRGEGNPKYYMGSSILTVVLNIVLDAVFVTVCDMGIGGIALASVIAAAAALAVNILFFVRNAQIYRFGRFTFKKDVLKNTILNGSSEFIGEMSMCITMFAYNLVIMRTVGENGVAAFAVVGYVSYVFSMICLGFGQGTNPLISFLYGAGERKEADDIRRITCKLLAAVGIVFTVIMLITANPYCNAFISEAEIRELAKTGILFFSPCFLMSGYNGMASIYFTSIGRAGESALISSARGLIVPLICIFSLPFIFGMNGVWLVSPVTELLTFVISVLCLRGDAKRRQHPAGYPAA